MASREPSTSRPAWASRRVIIAAAAAVALAAAGTATALVAFHSGADGHAGSARARLAAASCTGPAGAAYVALPGYQAFDAANPPNCDLVHQYNVGDRLAPNTGTQDFNYDSSE